MNDAPLVLEKELHGINIAFDNIDYLVLNMEPDHTGWMNGFMERNPNCEILLTQKASAILREFYSITENVRVVKTGDTLDLGNGRELLFVEAPNVHWPETMVTYEKSSKVLFACDAFGGSYGCLEDAVFDDQD